MRLRFVPARQTRPEDRHAMSLLAEGFRRLRAAKVSNAGTGAPGSGDANPPLHASDPCPGSPQGIANEAKSSVRDERIHGR